MQLFLFNIRATYIKEDIDGADVYVAPVKPEIKKPSKYQVVAINDDYTPMDFVVHVLEFFFGMPKEKANQVMLTIHNQGRAVCGVYTKDVAETKANQVNQYSKEHDYPLLCTIEKVE